MKTIHEIFETVRHATGYIKWCFIESFNKTQFPQILSSSSLQLMEEHLSYVIGFTDNPSLKLTSRNDFFLKSYRNIPLHLVIAITVLVH